MKFPMSSLPRIRVKWVLAGAFAAVFLAGCATSEPIGKPEPVAVGEEVRDSLRAAPELVVYEGLPHQTKERELMESEAVRPDVLRIHGYPFYTPAVPAMQQEALRRLMADGRTYRVYSGPKTCGGFHPDYAIHWKAGGRIYHILICYGCGEALFSDGTRLLPYDIKHRQLNELKALLSGHARKRPQSAR